MPTTKKIEIAKNLKEQFEKANSYVFVDYRGLTMANLSQLRKSLEKLGGSLTVAKNTLIEKATNIKNDGPTAILFAHDNPLLTIKALVAGIKDFASLKVKNGFFDGQNFTGEQILAIAQLPSREALIAKLAGVLKSPVYRLSNTLPANQRKFVLVLNSIAKSKKV